MAVAPRSAPKHPLAGVAALALGATCGGEPEVVFTPLVLEFAASESSAEESDEVSRIGVTLSAPAPGRVTFNVAVTDASASGHDACGTRDYSVVVVQTEFRRGESEVEIEIRRLNDDSSEIDERFSLELVEVDGARLGSRAVHEHTILDDDRSALFDVRQDFGATGDGATDDTEAIQEAIDRALLSEGAVVLFPPGTYVVANVMLHPSINYYGYGATITRSDDQPRDLQSFRLDYSGDEDSSPVFVQGFTFDGNRDGQQGPYTNWEYRNADLLVMNGDPTRAGRLHLVAEDLSFRMTGSSGLLLGPNTDADLCWLQADEVFTEFVDVSGGNSSLRAQSLTGNGSTGTAGITIQPTEAGFGDVLSTDVELADVDLQSGDLRIEIAAGSSVVGRRITVAQAPFLIRSPHSRVHVSDSLFTSGPALFDNNRIVAPGDVTFESTRFVLTEKPELTFDVEEQDRELRVLDVIWNDTELAYDDTVSDDVLEVLGDQQLLLRDCSFEVGADVEASDTVYAVGTTLKEPADGQVPSGTGNRVVIENPALDDDFDGLLAPECTGCEATTP